MLKYIPPLVSRSNPYHHRNRFARKVPTARLALYQNSFFISTTYLWNELPDNFKETDSIACFKRLLRKDDTIVPGYYFEKDRILEILHCKLRLEISDLQGDLVKRHLSNDPACQCGFPCENAKHYLFDCPLFDEARGTTIHRIDHLDYRRDYLLFRNPNRSYNDNVKIFQYVSDFIKLSNRFN